MDVITSSQMMIFARPVISSDAPMVKQFTIEMRTNVVDIARRNYVGIGRFIHLNRKEFSGTFAYNVTIRNVINSEVQHVDSWKWEWKWMSMLMKLQVVWFVLGVVDIDAIRCGQNSEIIIAPSVIVLLMVMTHDWTVAGVGIILGIFAREQRKGIQEASLNLVKFCMTGLGDCDRNQKESGKLGLFWNAQ
jgi:hypothetical protein